MNGMGLRMVNGFKKVMMMVDGWRFFFFKSGIPKSQGFNTEMVIHDLDDLGYHHLRKPPFMDIKKYR